MGQVLDLNTDLSPTIGSGTNPTAKRFHLLRTATARTLDKVADNKTRRKCNGTQGTHSLCIADGRAGAPFLSHTALLRQKRWRESGWEPWLPSASVAYAPWFQVAGVGKGQGQAQHPNPQEKRRWVSTQNTSVRRLAAGEQLRCRVCFYFKLNWKIDVCTKLQKDAWVCGGGGGGGGAWTSQILASRCAQSRTQTPYRCTSPHPAALGCRGGDPSLWLARSL